MLLAHKFNICFRSAIIYLSMELLRVNANVNGSAKITLNIPAELITQNCTIPDARHIFAHKCKKAEVQNSANAAIDGVTRSANLSAVLTEGDAVKLHRDLGTISEKCCQQRSQSATSDEWRCSENGEVVAVFVAEQGPECIERNKENTYASPSCKNITPASCQPERSGAEEARNFAELLDLAPKKCVRLEDFEKCAHSYWEQCNEIMPASRMEKVFQNVKSEIKCQSEIDRMVRQNSTVKSSNISHSVEKSAIEVLVSVFMLSVIAQLLRC